MAVSWARRIGNIRTPMPITNAELSSISAAPVRNNAVEPLRSPERTMPVAMRLPTPYAKKPARRRTPTIRAVRRTLESGRTMGGEVEWLGEAKARFLGFLCGLSVAVVMAPPMICRLRCKSQYAYSVRKSRATWSEVDGSEDQAGHQVPEPLEQGESARGGRRLRRRARDRIAQHAQARRGPRGGGDVAVQPRGQQGRASRRHGRPGLRRDRPPSGQSPLEDRDARAGGIGPAGVAPPSVGD